MGGFGSGRWRASGRGVVEETSAIRVHQMLPALEAGLRKKGISLDSWPRRCQVRARFTTGPQGHRLETPATINLEATSQHFGGLRWWFVCPCGLRSAKLYLSGHPRIFRCRTCHGLAYRTQHVSRTMRWYMRAEKILARAGCSRTDARYVKPPHMRRKTFRRLVEAAEEFEMAALAAELYPLRRYFGWDDERTVAS
jgi:hypothetical protein